MFRKAKYNFGVPSISKSIKIDLWKATSSAASINGAGETRHNKKCGEMLNTSVECG